MSAIEAKNIEQDSAIAGKLDSLTTAGSSTKPIYINSSGVPTAINYTLGAACERPVTTSVTSGSTALVTSGAVYDAINTLPPRYRILLSFSDFTYECTGLRADDFESSSSASSTTVYPMPYTNGTSTNSGTSTVSNTAFNWETNSSKVHTSSSYTENRLSVSNIPSKVKSKIFNMLEISCTGNFSGTVDLTLTMACYSKNSNQTRYQLCTFKVPYTIYINKKTCTIQNIGDITIISGRFIAGYYLASDVAGTFKFYITDAVVTSVSN